MSDHRLHWQPGVEEIVAREVAKAEARIAAAVLAALLPRSMRDNHAGSLYELGRYDLSEQIRAALADPKEKP